MMSDTMAAVRAEEGLGKFVARHDDAVRLARKGGIPAEILAAAEQAADAIEAEIGPAGPELSPAQRVALVAAKRMMFNAAADCWPGWGGNTPHAGEAELSRALKLATRSADLVHALGLGPMQEGTAAWLIGALELALGQSADALNSFALAARRYQDVPAPGMVHLTEGYIALACEAARRKLPEGVPELAQTLEALQRGNFEDGAALRAQLVTARGILLA